MIRDRLCSFNLYKVTSIFRPYASNFCGYDYINCKNDVDIIELDLFKLMIGYSISIAEEEL